MTRTKALLLVCVLCGSIGHVCYRLGYEKGIVSGFETGKRVGELNAKIEHLRKMMFGDNDTKKKEE